METGNIIALYNRNKQVALHEFESLMEKTNTYMNEIASTTNHYVGCDSKGLECETVKAIQKQCAGTPFTPDDIELISGQVLMGDNYYPAVIKRIIGLTPTVKQILPETDFQSDIKEYNTDLYNAEDKYKCWVRQIVKQYPNIERLGAWLYEND